VEDRMVVQGVEHDDVEPEDGKGQGKDQQMAENKEFHRLYHLLFMFVNIQHQPTIFMSSN